MQGTTYNQLSIFHEIVSQGSISGAARQLEIAAPSVSQALKTLEQNIGLSLFNRSTRRIELTEAGQRLYEQTLPALNSLKLALDSVKDMSENPSGKVRLTLPRLAWQLWLKGRYHEFCQRFPDVQLELSINDGIVDIVEEGIDVGIRFGDKVEEGMVARKLTPPFKEALFASPDYLERHGYPKTPECLKHHKQIYYRFISSNRFAPMVLQEDGQDIHVQMPPSLIVNDTDLMVDAAIKGQGIGMLIEQLVAKPVEQGQLRPVLQDYWRQISGLYVYFPQGSQKIRRNRVLIDFLVQSFAL